MKMGRLARWLFLVAPLMTGCSSGFWNPSGGSGSGGNGGSGSGASGGAFYILNQATNQLAAFTISSGTLTALSNSPYTLASAPFAIAISPGGNFLYVSLGSGIYLYTLSGGVPTIGNGGQPISEDIAGTMQVDPTGQWLIEGAAGTVSAVPINPSSGLFNTARTEATATLPAGTSNTPSTLVQLAVSPTTSNPYVFVAMGPGGTAVIPFFAGNANPFGNVASFRVKYNGGSDNAVGVDPSNRLLYVGEVLGFNGNSGGLRVFTISAGGTAEITGSPYASGGTGPSSILTTASTAGDYVYVANNSGSAAGTIGGFAVAVAGTSTAPTYSLTSVGDPVTTGDNPAGLAEDSTGTYVLVVNSGGNPDLEAYTIGATGTLTSALSKATGIDPVGAVGIASLPPTQ